MPLARRGRERGEVGDLEQGVGEGLAEERARPRRDRRLDRGGVREVGQGDRRAEGRQVPLQQLLGHRVEVGGGDQVSAAGQQVEQRRADRRHPGAGRHRVLGSFQVGQLQLQAADRRVAVAGVEEVGRALRHAWTPS